MVQKDDVIGVAAALGHGFLAAQAGINLNAVAPQNALGYHQVHFLVVYCQSLDAHAGKGLPARGLVLRKAPLPQLPVEQVGHREGGKGLMYDEQTAFAGQGELPFRDYHNPEGARQLFVVVWVLLILSLGDEHMGQRLTALQFEQALKVMDLIALDAQTLHQVHDQAVIVAPDLVAAVLLRLEIAGDAEPLRVVEYDAGLVVGDPPGGWRCEPEGPAGPGCRSG